MIIGIDGNEANIKNRVGVNTYAYELIRSFKKLQVSGENIHQLIVYLKNKPLPDMPEETANFKYKIIPGERMWVITRLTPYLFFNKDNLDIFFSPSHYLPPVPVMPLACSIMDLGYLEFSGQFKKTDFWQLKLWSAISIFISKHIFAISDSTKKDIVRHYPSVKRKIHTTHLAYDAEKFNLGIPEKDVRHIRSRYSIVSDYILYLGTLKPSKNLEGLIQAFSILYTGHRIPNDMQLVVAGKKGWMFESIYQKTKDLGLENKIIFTDFVPEEEKPALIKGAKVFVLPSFWEGFGLDALNAMAAGVPVVVSNIGSLPEVVGDAGILVDPGNIESIAEGIGKVISLNKTDYHSMIEKGVSQAAKFSWERTARKTLEILTNYKNQNTNNTQRHK